MCAKIVISSDWRIDSNWQNRLERAGLKHIIDKTPITIWSGHEFSRGEEIDMWLQSHLSVKNYVIIDDREDMMVQQKDHFVKVNPYCGLTDEDVEKAMKILDKHDN